MKEKSKVNHKSWIIFLVFFLISILFIISIILSLFFKVRVDEYNTTEFTATVISVERNHPFLDRPRYIINTIEFGQLRINNIRRVADSEELNKLQYGEEILFRVEDMRVHSMEFLMERGSPIDIVALKTIDHTIISLESYNAESERIEVRNIIISSIVGPITITLSILFLLKSKNNRRNKI